MKAQHVSHPPLQVNFGTAWTDDAFRARHVGVEADNPGVKHEAVSFRLCRDQEETWKKKAD